jgi:hypothetical protein
MSRGIIGYYLIFFPKFSRFFPALIEPIQNICQKWKLTHHWNPGQIFVHGLCTLTRYLSSSGKPYSEHPPLILSIPLGTEEAL